MDVEFAVDSRHASVARAAAGALRARVTPEEAEALSDTLNNRKRPPESDGIAVDRLRSLVERIERLEEERRAFGSDIKDIYQEAKSAGFDTKVLRQLIRIRKQEAAEVEEEETILDMYRRALGM